MANLKVISNSAFSNYPTHVSDRWNAYQVREDEGEYHKTTDDLLNKVNALLNEPLWPKFPDGIYLKPDEAERLYRLAHGAQGLIHILNRSIHLSSNAKGYEDEPDIWLNEFQESQVWAAMIEMGRDLVSITDQLHGKTATDVEKLTNH